MNLLPLSDVGGDDKRSPTPFRDFLGHGFERLIIASGEYHRVPTSSELAGCLAGDAG